MSRTDIPNPSLWLATATVLAAIATFFPLRSGLKAFRTMEF